MGAQKMNAVIQPTHIELTAVCLHTQKVSAKTLAEPVACFGLQHPVLPPTLVRHGPTVEIAGHIQCPSGRKTHFRSYIDSCGGVIKEIALQGKVLSFHKRTAKKQKRKQKNILFKFHLIYRLYYFFTTSFYQSLDKRSIANS